MQEVRDMEKHASPELQASRLPHERPPTHRAPGQAVVRALRAYECSDAFVTLELENFYKPLDFKRLSPSHQQGQVGAVYSPQNYQYGTFFFNGFRTMFEAPGMIFDDVLMFGFFDDLLIFA